LDNPTSYEEIIHPEDRVQVLARLDEATRTGKFNERFRITLPNGDVRWVRVYGFPMRNAAGRIWRLVGTAQDITEQKHAEDQVIKNLEIAEAARAEADALRKATLALTQDLHMWLSAPARVFVVPSARMLAAQRPPLLRKSNLGHESRSGSYDRWQPLLETAAKSRPQSDEP